MQEQLQEALDYRLKRKQFTHFGTFVMLTSVSIMTGLLLGTAWTVYERGWPHSIWWWMGTAFNVLATAMGCEMYILLNRQDRVLEYQIKLLKGWLRAEDKTVNQVASEWEQFEAAQDDWINQMKGYRNNWVHRVAKCTPVWWLLEWGNQWREKRKAVNTFEQRPE